jgi:hypothetical protein
LQTHLSSQQQRRSELDAEVIQQQVRQHRLLQNLEKLRIEHQQLETQIAALMSQRNSLEQELAQPTPLSSSIPEPKTVVKENSVDSLPASSGHIKNAPNNDNQLTFEELENLAVNVINSNSSPLISRSDQSYMPLNHSDPISPRQFWEQKVLPYWLHHNRPKGQRFMGSFRISRSATDKLLELVGMNLKKIGKLTEKRLRNRFGNASDDWSKIITLALSEYAYYYSESDSGFWQGFCHQLNLVHTQNAEQALRLTADRGIDLLGLARARGGYRYVSTLWLQSGIPHKNLDQFAQLLQDLQAEYGWEHLTEADHIALAEILYDTCHKRYPNWGTLRNFLASSCEQDDNEACTKVDPISGQLLQGIAVVAQELERRSISPQILLDDQEREALLESSYLPKNFFLRSWETLTKVITLRDTTSARRRLFSLRPKELFLELNLETLDTQLVLPEQAIWKPSWNKDLRGTYCQIPEAEWEETLPPEGGLEIPELVVPVEIATKKLNLTLFDHKGSELHQWSYNELSNDLACLIFDARTGEHIPLNPLKPTIIGTAEVICFTPKGSIIEPGIGVELRDRGIPSSLRGWHGLHLERIATEASINLRYSPTETTKIQWEARSTEPILQGLQLLGRKTVYLSIPTLWLPITPQAVTLNLLVENMVDKSVVLRQLVELAAREEQLFSLEPWIQNHGHYVIKLWNATYQWSNRFEIRNSYHIENSAASLFEIHYQNQDYIHLPIQLGKVNQFWAANIELIGLWPLEPVKLWLSNGNVETICTLQANRLGSLEISLDQFYDLLPKSNFYILSYQPPGQEPQKLLEVTSTLNFPNPDLQMTTTKVEPTLPKVIHVKSSSEPTIKTPSHSNSNWHLVKIKSYKREIFCKQLKHRLDNQFVDETGIIDFQSCNAEIYGDYVLVQVQQMTTARKTLQAIEHFLRVEPKALSEIEVKKMLGG